MAYPGSKRGFWQRWVQQPQQVFFRKAVFQVHLWSGIGLGLYVLFISITGSILVYRNELYVWATPEEGVIQDGRVALGVRLVSALIEVHDNFLAGSIGQIINGLAGIGVLLIAATGLFIWWPGKRRWRRSLTLHRGVGWRRMVWDLHSMVGFWSFAIIVMFALSGIYLCFPEAVHRMSDWITPTTPENAGRRFIDDVLYWLAFSHFGRINGIGIPCSGPGLCDQATKAAWALMGLAPAVMFASGALMWWNRVLRRRVKRSASPAAK